MDQIPIGSIIINPRKPEWGPGKVANVRGGTAYVFFRDLPDRRAKGFKLDQLVLSDEQSDPVLDNLPPFVEEDGGYVLPGERITLEMAIARFLEIYPQGFYDPSYLDPGPGGERGYKWEAHQLYQSLLGNGKAEVLLSVGEIHQLVSDLSRVGGRVNLLAVQEASAFREGLNNDAAASRFFETLLALISQQPARKEFEDYAAAVAALPTIGATNTNKWTIATIMPFLARPDAYMFIKPTVTQRAAERLGFDIRYDPRPNWRTFEAVLTMSRVYREKLASLNPRDFIDVQSFFWVTGDQYHITKQRRRAAR